jgi:hypothetical protein
VYQQFLCANQLKLRSSYAYANLCNLVLFVIVALCAQAAAKMLKKDKKAADASTDSTKKIA